MIPRREALFPATAAAALAVLSWLYFVDELPLRAGVSFHHMASVRELSKGEFPPSHNLVAGKTPQGHYGPYLVLLGFVKRYTGADALVLLETAGLVLLLLFLVAFHGLVGRMAGPDAARWSALAALLLWGPWPARDMPWIAWGWPGTTALADAWNFFYPQHAAVIALLALLTLCVGPRLTGRRLAAAVLLSGLVLTTHPLTGLGLATALVALVVADLWRREIDSRRLLTILLLPAAGLLAAGLWPYYPVFKLLPALVAPEFRQSLPSVAPAAVASRGGVNYAWLFLEPVQILGPAILGLAWAFVLARRQKPFLLLWSLAALFVTTCPLVPLRARLVTFAALPLQIASAGLLAAGWKRGRAAKAGILLLLGASAFVAAERAAFVRRMEPRDLGFVERLTPEDAVILSDEATSSAAAGLTGRKIVAPDGPDLFLIMMGDGSARMRDVLRFVGPKAGPEEREAILRRWRVTHVLLDHLVRRPLRLPYPVVHEAGGYVLYDVRAVTSARDGS